MGARVGARAKLGDLAARASGANVRGRDGIRGFPL